MKSDKESKRMLTWQDFEKFRPYITETGKILPRRITRLSAAEQRHISKTIKQARNLLLLP
jgi:small subunit ribosomal protein S18